MIGVGGPVAPDALQVSRQATRRRHNHRIRRQRFVEYAKDAALRQGGVGYLTKFAIHRFPIQMVVDFRDESGFLPHRLVNALGLFQLAALYAFNLLAPASLPGFAGQGVIEGGEGFAGIRQHRNPIQLPGVEVADVNIEEAHARVLENPF